MAAPIVTAASILRTVSATNATAWNVGYKGYNSGDLVLMLVNSDGSTVTHGTLPATGPNGEVRTILANSAWIAGAGPTMSFWWYVATDTRVAGTVPLTVSVDHGFESWSVVIPNGQFDPANPIEAFAQRGDANNTASIASPVINGITAGGRVCHFYAVDTDEITSTPVGYTDIGYAAVTASTVFSLVKSMFGTRDAETTANETIASEIRTVANDTSITIGFVINGPLASTLVITGPSTGTEGSTVNATGQQLDTVTVLDLRTTDLAHSIVQTIDSKTETTLNYIARTGVSAAIIGTPVTGIPFAASILATGVTSYIVEQHITDGTNNSTSAFSLLPEATHEVLQAMVATSNVVDGESVFGVSLITVEDNMQVYLPKVVNGMTISWLSDGTFTTDLSQTETFEIVFYSPTTGQWSAHNLTVNAADGSDTQAPIISLVGASTVNLTTGASYVDAGATATDNVDGDLTGSIVTVNPVNTAIPATYIVTYNVVDAAGNNALQVSRTVIVSDLDTIAPVITLLGTNNIVLNIGSVYVDAGATAADNIDGDLTGIITTVNPVNTAIAAVYTVTYNVTDAAGNTATQVARTVTVRQFEITETLVSSVGVPVASQTLDYVLSQTWGGPILSSGTISTDIAGIFILPVGVTVELGTAWILVKNQADDDIAAVFIVTVV